MVLDGVILQDIQRTIERGRKMGILKEGDTKPDMGTILYIDMVWRTLNISHDLDTDKIDFELQHKKMLQFGNLNKILATYEQIRSKKEAGKVEEGLFAKIVKESIATDKKKEAEMQKKFEAIAVKVARGEQLTEEEQIIFDAGCESALA
ncbi:MAG: hypothetical protein M0R80_03455 [Proteobacteria bacterium]|nr:hypothetical protein [Pseudomonadota bacterium]